MSPRRLAGWEPREFVEYVREGNRVVGHVVTREPEWSPQDVRLVLAQYEWERSLGSHGIPLDEAMSNEANPNNYKGGFYFETPPPLVDWAEKSRRSAEKKYREEHPGDDMDGLVFQPVKRSRTQQG